MNIQDVPFFEGIDTNVIEEIKNACSAKTFDKGETLFEKGSPANYLYILEEGDIDLLLRKTDNTIFNLNQPGEIFGWSSIVEKGVYTSTSTCNSSTSVLRIPKEKIEALFDQHPRAAVKFYQRLGSIFSKRLSKAIE